MSRNKNGRPEESDRRCSWRKPLLTQCEASFHNLRKPDEDQKCRHANDRNYDATEHNLMYPVLRLISQGQPTPTARLVALSCTRRPRTVQSCEGRTTLE